MKKMTAILAALVGFTGWVMAEDQTEDFAKTAKDKHGEPGFEAAKFLVAAMPEKDREGLTKEFLMENLELALKARAEFSWAKELPKPIFWNEVLPYASLDETRESWRPEFYKMCAPLVKDCKTATEAAQVLNKEVFNLINVHYNTGRKKPNQSPAESKKLGMATCTGLSIILVNACRSVGVPARIAGTALWSDKRGNHTWVEIYDGGKWSFTGADEYDANGLNRGWFQADAAKGIPGGVNAIWATSWGKTENHFPMVWAFRDRSVPAVDVTARYAQKVEKEEGVFVRVWDRQGGKRVIATINGTLKTKAGTSDLNDMVAVKAKAGDEVEVSYDGKSRKAKLSADTKAKDTVDLYWDQLK